MSYIGAPDNGISFRGAGSPPPQFARDSYSINVKCVHVFPNDLQYAGKCLTKTEKVKLPLIFHILKTLFREVKIICAYIDAVKDMQTCSLIAHIAQSPGKVLRDETDSTMAVG